MDQHISLAAHIEALLFVTGEPLKVAKISELLEVSDKEIGEALSALTEALQDRGIRLVQSGDQVELRSAPEVSSMVEKAVATEHTKDLGKAGLETLTIVLYRGPIAKRDIDYIRGVNSGFILRNLMIRGLVERITDPKDSRSYIYKPTVALLGHLGITRIEDLPEYETFEKHITALHNEDTPDNTTEANEA